MKSRIGVQLQQSSFPENFLAHEIVELFALFYGVKVDAMALLTAVGLEDKANQRRRSSPVASASGFRSRRRS